MHPLASIAARIASAATAMMQSARWLRGSIFGSTKHIDTS
jgi:hypothetical protein